MKEKKQIKSIFIFIHNLLYFSIFLLNFLEQNIVLKRENSENGPDGPLCT